MLKSQLHVVWKCLKLNVLATPGGLQCSQYYYLVEQTLKLNVLATPGGPQSAANTISWLSSLDGIGMYIDAEK